MLKSPNNLTDFNLLLPEVILLESEYFDQAKNISSQVRDESSQWQIYLNTLALIALEEWLKERISEQSISQTNQITENTCSLKIGEFRVCVIATDNLLHELVYLPKNVVESPELATHFYVVLEVLEEQEKVIFRGCLRYDQLVDYRNHVNLQPQDNLYQLPLSLFDTEPNHLLFYCRFLEPTSIPLPVVSAQMTTLLTNMLQTILHIVLLMCYNLQGRSLINRGISALGHSVLGRNASEETLERKVNTLGLTARTIPTPNIQGQLIDHKTAMVTSLTTREESINFDQFPPVPLTFIFQLTKKFTPTSVRDRTSKFMVSHQIPHCQVFNSNQAIFSH